MFHALRDRLRRFLPALKPILCCGAFAAAAFSFMPCAPLSAKDASEAAAKAYQRHRTQRLGMFSLSKITSAPVVMLGDSLTKRAQWAEITGCPFLANRGIGGDTSAGVLSRLEESLKLRPRAVFLMIGINDITSHVPTDTIAANVNKIVDGLEAANAHIYLSFVLPVTKHYAIKINPQVKDLNEALEKLSQRPAVTLIDLRPKMSDEEGNLRGDLAVDGIHLSAEGYRIWRDAIAPLVEANCTAPAVMSQLH